MNYMDMSYSATPSTRGVKAVSPATGLSSQRDIPHDPSIRREALREKRLHSDAAR